MKDDENKSLSNGFQIMKDDEHSSDESFKLPRSSKDVKMSVRELSEDDEGDEVTSRHLSQEGSCPHHGLL